MGNIKVHELIENRWSPRAYLSKEVENEKLQRIFEASRRAPSAMNEQPWRYVVGLKKDVNVWKSIADSLNESNQIWAQHAPVLILTLVKKHYTRNGSENTSRHYDLGQSVAYLSIQATNEGLFLHQMGGFSREKAIENLQIPEEFEPVTVIALGYKGDLNSLPPNLQEREKQMVNRFPINELVFSGWGEKLFE
ncbi:nitroreductase family protein [Sporocytophaga myxococcoides]|uniref:nitroreductase family protein n=1 Tax=Sporocytophaga myxococcoides TaxID=153721 RepID=UPI0004267ABE|nr:nitroreductase family protein [Sporocytophaga myxococcoides]